MRTRWPVCFVVLAALTACDPAGRAHAPAADADAAVDAGPDADLIDEHAVPISVSGTTPLGPLEGFGFAEAFYTCGNRLILQLKTTPKVDHEPYIEVVLHAPASASGPASGPLPATAAALRWDPANGWSSAGYTQATFDAMVVDPPDVAPARMSGTVTASDAGWMLAFPVDLTFYPSIGSCTL